MQYKLVLFASFFCIFLTHVFAQTSIKNFVKNSSFKIQSINPENDSYDDLRAIGDAIGTDSLVLLGEQSHGDASTFLAKTRLIKYLHQQKGFTVLAFESDFFALNLYDARDFKDSLAITKFIANNIMPIWTKCHTLRALFSHYIPSTLTTLNPLVLSGFDCQFHGANVPRKLRNYLTNLYDSLNIVNAIPQNKFNLLSNYFDSLMMYQTIKDTNVLKQLIEIVTLFKNELVSKISVEHFALRLIKSLEGEIKSKLNFITKTKDDFYFRDKQMAENILWLKTVKYAKQKIIVWAHNGHIAKNAYSKDSSKFTNFVKMGNWLSAYQSLKNKIYVLGFSSYTGQSKWATTKNYDIIIKKPNHNTFESWIPKKYDFAFTNFKSFNALNNNAFVNFSLKGSHLNTNQHSSSIQPWNKIYDGIFFIRKMEGCNQ